MKSSVYKQRARHTHDPRPPKSWLGFVTLLAVILIGSGLAIAMQFGLAISFEDFLRPLHYIFFTLAFPGVLAGAIVEGNGHGISFDIHRTGQAVAPLVNAVIYVIVILLWLKFSGDRLKK
jgi:hypothetical protein